MSTKVSETTKKWSEDAEIIRRQEFQELKERVDSLEQRLDQIEKG